MFLVHPFFGPGLFRIYSKTNHISPWYIICLVQDYITYILGQFPFLVRGCLSYIPGPFTFTFLVHHCLGPGLFRIHSMTNHISPWYIICLVQDYITYILGQFPFLVQGCLSSMPGPFTCTCLVHHCLGPGLFRIHSKTNHISPWYIICLVQGCLSYPWTFCMHMPGASLL